MPSGAQPIFLRLIGTLTEFSSQPRYLSAADSRSRVASARNQPSHSPALDPHVRLDRRAGMCRSGHSFVNSDRGIQTSTLDSPEYCGVTALYGCVSAADNRVTGRIGRLRKTTWGVLSDSQKTRTSLAAVSAAHLTHDQQSSDLAPACAAGS